MSLTIDPKEVSTALFHSYMLGAVAPRPIAFASTIDKEGNVNLSPFSFFNAFSANPPILIFSPARRVRDNTTKHTLENVLEVDEVVINIVDFPLVEQCSLSSTEYPKGVNEFEKAGLSQVASTKVKPPRVGEAPASFECKVKQVISLGDQGGAGNLIICEVVLAHFHEKVLDANGKFDPKKVELVGRCGGEFYVKCDASSMFEIPKPLTTIGIGIDQLPIAIRNSEYLTGNELARLANIEKMPSLESLEAISISNNGEHPHLQAKACLAKGELLAAWKYLLLN